jgi:hypothetical protein
MDRELVLQGLFEEADADDDDGGCAEENGSGYENYDGGGEDDGSGGGEEDDGNTSTPSGCDSDIVLELQMRIVEYEAKIRLLSAKLESQRLLLEQLQTDALMSFDMPKRLTKGDNSFPDHPLLVAADAGDASMVGLLLQKGADPTIHSNAALLLACQNGHVDVAEMLLEHGADVSVDYDSPLLWAAQHGDEALTRMLLAKGARPDRLDRCALRLATRMGHVGVVDALLDGGAKLGA